MKRQLLTTAAILALAGCATSTTGTSGTPSNANGGRKDTGSIPAIIDERSDLTSTLEQYLSENPSFERGYAGLFTQEDLNGKTIGDYEINPPRMLRPFYSTDLNDYFNDFPEVREYYDALDDELGNNGLATDPYLEEDAKYRETIMADDSLSVDQKLELIIKNHQGYLGNIEIDELVEEKFSSVYTDYKEVIDEVIGRFGYTDAWEAAEQQMPEESLRFNNYRRSQNKPLDPDRPSYYSIAHQLTGVYNISDADSLVFYGDDVLIAYDSEEDYSRELAVKVARAYEILEQRIPALISYLIGEEGERFTGLALNEVSNGMSSPRIEESDDAVYSINSFNIGPKYLEGVRGSIEGDQLDFKLVNENLVTLFFHECIHTALTTEGLTELDIDQQALDEAITAQGGTRDTSSYEGLEKVSPPIYTVELNTSLHQGKIGELLNASPKGIYSSFISLNSYLRRGREDGHDFTQDKIFDLIEYVLYE